MSDFRHAARSLLRNPAFTAVAIVSLALGIGANTAIFSLIDAVMLRALPVQDPDGLVRLTLRGPDAEEFSNPVWEELRDTQESFSGTFAYANDDLDLSDGGESRPLKGSWVSGGFFPTLGVTPAAGRLLTSADDTRGCAPVAVLGHGFWQSEYGGNTSVVGRTISLAGQPFEIVGVAPDGFFGFDVGRSPQLYAPLCARAALLPPDGGLEAHDHWFLRVGGRLRPGVSYEQARSRVQAMAPTVFRATLPPDWPNEWREDYLGYELGLEAAANGYSDLRAIYDRALAVLMLVVGLVLLIACANVANLMLARATARRREMAIRRAIGAGRAHLIRRLLAESLLISLVGAALGIAVALWGAAYVVNLFAAGSEGLVLDVSLNGRILAFTLLVAVGTALLFGLAPALRSARVEPQTALRSSDRSVMEGMSRFSAGKALVVGQIALSLVLLVGAALLLRSFRDLATIDPGFQSEGVLLAELDLRKAGYPEVESPARKAELIERLRATPGIRFASASELVPLSGNGMARSIYVEGFEPRGERDNSVWFNAVTDDFFATLSTPLLAGREFGPQDGENGPRVAVINRALARKFFGDRNPIGEAIAYGPPVGNDREVAEVVGVVGDSRYWSLRDDVAPVIYLPYRQEGNHRRETVTLQLRGEGATEALIPVVTRVVGEVSPRISISYSILSEMISARLTRERLLATLSGFFGGLALLLAVIGLYGMMATNVARRRREIGVRMALGAHRGRLLRMVLSDAGGLVAAGLLLGAVASLGATRIIASFLYGVSPTDVGTLALAAALLAAVALAAGAVPAWRAARVDPMVVLREE